MHQKLHICLIHYIYESINIAIKLLILSYYLTISKNVIILTLKFYFYIIKIQKSTWKPNLNMIKYKIKWNICDCLVKYKHIILQF